MLSEIAWYITFACEIIALAWMAVVCGALSLTSLICHSPAWFANMLRSFPDETIALGMFVMFAIVDGLNWKIYKARHAVHTANAARSIALLEESKFSLNQALYVDAPVVVGIFISFNIARYLVQNFDGLELYVSGFFSGATVMHLAASQIIFSILAFRKDYSIEKQIELVQKLAGS